MNILALILLATLSCGIVAVSLRLHANLARQRLTALGNQQETDPAPALSIAQRGPDPDLTGELPDNDIHLIKARLLANAALNEYIGGWKGSGTS